MTGTKQAVAAAIGVVAVASVASSAFAQDAHDPGFYVSGGANYLMFEGDDGVDADIGALTGRAGLKLSRWLSVEGDASFGIDDGSFDFNVDEDDFDLDDNSDGDVADVINAPGDFGLDYMLGAHLRASAPVGDTMELYGRAGYAFAEVESTVVTPGGATLQLGDSESGPSFGAGGALHLTTNQAVRLDYTYTDFDLAEAHGLGLTYQVRF